MRALERDRARRWPTAHELERALAEVVRAGARSLEDTDVGAFLRRMFPEEAGVAEPVQRHGVHPHLAAPSPVLAKGRRRGAPVGRRPRRRSRPSASSPTPAEPAPTEVLPGARGRSRRWVGAALAVAGHRRGQRAVALRSGPARAAGLASSAARAAGTRRPRRPRRRRTAVPARSPATAGRRRGESARGDGRRGGAVPRPTPAAGAAAPVDRDAPRLRRGRAREQGRGAAAGHRPRAPW